MTRESKNDNYRLATFDIETDPFLHGRVPMPFTCGFFDGEDYYDFWGDDCIADAMEYIDSRAENFRIYVHNGGGFDFWYTEDFITNPVFFINKRIAKCGLMGRHEFRDSYKMIPVPLSAWNKESIDYSKLERKVRNKHKKEILHYQEMDCRHLYDMVSRFIEDYGNHLTIGSAALKELRRYHPNKFESQYFDKQFRPYYMGGRVECFKRGEIRGDLKLYDVNSEYPAAMHSFAHPAGNQYKIRYNLPDNGNVFFAIIRAESKGALPLRGKRGLEFPHGENVFHACSHEIIAARQLGLLKIKEVIECREFIDSQNFAAYVDHFSDLKVAAEEVGDKGGRLFAKLFMNNAYGKWGQDPSKYRDYLLIDAESDVPDGYLISGQFGERFIAERPTELKSWSFKNVAIAASITSAARSILLRGIHSAVNPVYCDTDSIICDDLDMELHPTKLGAWKLEASGDRIYIAGKKMYALFDGDVCVKKASKGVQLDAATIGRISVSDDPVSVKIDAPVLRAAKKAKFIERKIRQTA